MARINERERRLVAFGAVLARESTGAANVAHAGATLCALGRRIDALAVRYCNGDIQGDRYDRLSDKAEAAALEIVKGLGDEFGVVVGGDPRGCCLKVVLPSGYSDSMGGDGLCVPYDK